jgi:hypothetical protein
MITVELCFYCKKYLGILILDNKPCCQFCLESKTDK